MLKQRIATVEKAARGRRRGRLNIVVIDNLKPAPDPAILAAADLVYLIREVDNWREL